MSPEVPQSERSPEARALAERALIDLVRELEGSGVEMIVLGGLVPEVLTEGQDPPAPPHIGTADVDLLLRTRVDLEEDLLALEQALQQLDFEPHGSGWRWRGVIRGRAVKVEFLCDLPNRTDFERVALAGCESLEALNIRGTGYVAMDWNEVTLTTFDDAGEGISARVRFARLGGYLLSKCAAARTRGLDKDFYDLVYVLINNRDGGPLEGAAAVLANERLRAAVSGELRNTLLEARARFGSPAQAGPTAFAAESMRVDASLSEAALRTEAVVAAEEFFGAGCSAREA